MIFTIKVGDVFDEGSGHWKIYHIKTTLPSIEAVESLYESVQEISGIRVRELCWDYDRKLTPEQVERLREMGFDFNSISIEDDYEVNQIDDLIKIVIFLLKYADHSQEYEIIEFPTLAERDIFSLGYGFFIK